MSTRPVYRIAAVVAAAVALVLGAFAAYRFIRAGQVLGTVEALGADVSGLSLDEATQVLAEREQELATASLSVRIGDQAIELEPTAVGFSVDEASGAEAALLIGREGTIPDQFRWWLSGLFATNRVDVAAAVDPAALEQVLAVWDDEVVARPASEGDVVIEDGQLRGLAPASGLAIERSQSASVLVNGIVTQQPVELAVVEAKPRLTAADIEEALAAAGLLLSGPVTLRTTDGLTATFSVEDLSQAFTAEVFDESAPTLHLGFDPTVIEKLLTPLRADLESAPVDARFEIATPRVNLVPGQKGTKLNAEDTVEALMLAAASASRTGLLPLTEGADPETTTEELVALDITHLVSSFTTYHDCCQPRVTNIHLLADRLDGTIVNAGEVFSINRNVGERTEAQGYVLAPTILFGEIKDTIGGGVSQFATTFYGAVFWGGYEDVTHAPHTLYFPRYPEGIEATISWPLPDLEFRNDTPSAVLIDTEYTGTSITVRFFSNNDGRTMVGEQSGGKTRVSAVAEGGRQARRVEANVSERYAPTEPSVQYRANPLLGVDEQNELQTPRGGWSVTVTRTITVGDDQDKETSWVVRYRPRHQIIEVHPCLMPDATEPCPTTTTIPGDTTTIPGDTTTTTVAG